MDPKESTSLPCPIPGDPVVGWVRGGRRERTPNPWWVQNWAYNRGQKRIYRTLAFLKRDSSTSWEWDPGEFGRKGWTRRSTRFPRVTLKGLNFWQHQLATSPAAGWEAASPMQEVESKSLVYLLPGLGPEKPVSLQQHSDFWDGSSMSGGSDQKGKEADKNIKEH